MTFSQEVKEELSKLNNLANKNEVQFEALGYFECNNISSNENYIKFSTESEYNINRFAKIIRNIGIEEFNINVNGKLFCIEIAKTDFEDLKIFNNYINNIEELKAYTRGVFMGAGSINNPESKYHLECGLKDFEKAENIKELLYKFEINVKQRENIIYIKDGEEISKFLAFIGAPKSVLKFEEIRVQREMNNKVNRLVNCETANLNKVLNASIEQIEAMRQLKKDGKFDKLDDSLKEIANLRLEYPDMPLIELGLKLSNPIGKSGVNYRLKKIIKIAKGEA